MDVVILLRSLTCWILWTALLSGCGGPVQNPDAEFNDPERAERIKAHDPEAYKQMKASGQIK